MTQGRTLAMSCVLLLAAAVGACGPAPTSAPDARRTQEARLHNPETRIELTEGTRAVEQEGSLPVNATMQFVVRLEKGTAFSVMTESQPHPVTVAVLGVDRTALQRPEQGRPSFRGSIPTTQDYYVYLVGGTVPITYTVTFGLPAVTPRP